MPNLKPYRTKAQKAEARALPAKLRTAPGAAMRRSACMASKANGTGTKPIKCRCASRAGHGARTRRSSKRMAPCSMGAVPSRCQRSQHGAFAFRELVASALFSASSSMTRAQCGLLSVQPRHGSWRRRGPFTTQGRRTRILRLRRGELSCCHHAWRRMRRRASSALTVTRC